MKITLLEDPLWKCYCNDGFVGDGRICKRERTSKDDCEKGLFQTVYRNTSNFGVKKSQ